MINPADLAGDETKYKYEYRKYTKNEIQHLCEGMPAEALYKPEGMVKVTGLLRNVDGERELLLPLLRLRKKSVRVLLEILLIGR